MTVQPMPAQSTDQATQARIDLAAAHRLAVMDDLHEGTWNHFSLKLPGTDRFLLSPKTKHWSQVKASNVLEVGPEDQDRIQAGGDMLWVAYRIHAPVQWARPDIGAVLHVHSPYILAVAMLEDATLALAEQNALGFQGRIAYTEVYDGFVPQDMRHGEFIAEAIGDKPILMLRNHGAVVVGPTIGQAYADLYLLDRAARALVLALSTGRPLRLVPEDVADRFADDEVNLDYKDEHFEAMKEVLDEREPSYKD
jgi:ribulose-5-phosphate 4-epimerase/fuculose-1-phosphate aldolase